MSEQTQSKSEIGKDNKIESEFKYKRASLYRILKDLDAYEVPLNLVSEIYYDRRIRIYRTVREHQKTHINFTREIH